MMKRFDPDYYESLRLDLLEEVANEYIKQGFTPEEAWEKAEDDTPIAYDLWEDAMAEHADMQYELMRDRELGL